MGGRWHRVSSAPSRAGVGVVAQNGTAVVGIVLAGAFGACFEEGHHSIFHVAYHQGCRVGAAPQGFTAAPPCLFN